MSVEEVEEQKETTIGDYVRAIMGDNMRIEDGVFIIEPSDVGMQLLINYVQLAHDQAMLSIAYAGQVRIIDKARQVLDALVYQQTVGTEDAVNPLDLVYACLGVLNGAEFEDDEEEVIDDASTAE